MVRRRPLVLGAAVVLAMLTAAAGAQQPPSQAASMLLLGSTPLQAERLSQARGGTEVLNDMKLQGVVKDNQAVNVLTGSNLISEGALAGSAGLPMVIQNSGNNVLIQNATIVNLQLK